MPRKSSSVRSKRTRPGDVPRLLCNPMGYAYFYLPNTRKKVYCGQFGTQEAIELHLRKWNEYLASSKIHSTETAPVTVTVAILVDRFLQHADEYYPKVTAERFFYSVRPLYASLPTSKFGPVSLKAVREKMVAAGTLARKTVNTRVNCIRQIFRWGVENSPLLHFGGIGLEYSVTVRGDTYE